MRRRSGSRRKRESGGCYQRFRTHHSDEPGSHSSLCRSDEKSCTNNFSASGPFELRFTGGQTVRLTAKRSNLILRTSNGSPPVWAEPVVPICSAQTGGDPFDVLRIRFDRLAVKRTVWPPVNLNSNGPDALKLFEQLFSSLLQRLECDPGSSE